MLNKVNLFLLGGPKTGSTSLHDYLNQHPEIFLSPDKEPHYFCKDYYEEAKAFHNGKTLFFKYTSFDAYSNLFKDVTQEKVIGDCSTSYASSSVAAQLIYEHNPNAKFIAILREPMDMAYSWFNFGRLSSNEDKDSFQLALESENERLQDWTKIPAACDYPSSLAYSKVVNHEANLKRFLKYFDSEQILIMPYNDYLQDTLGSYAKMLKFLGVAEDFVPELNMLNESAKPRSVKLKTILDQLLFKRLKREFYPYKNSVVFRNLKKFYLFIFTSKGKYKDPLLSEQSDNFKDYFKDYVSNLSTLTHIDFNKMWGY